MLKERRDITEFLLTTVYTIESGVVHSYYVVEMEVRKIFDSVFFTLLCIPYRQTLGACGTDVAHIEKTRIDPSNAFDDEYAAYAELKRIKERKR